jgi:competence protein ComEC
MKRVLMITGFSLFLSLALLSFLPPNLLIIVALVFVCGALSLFLLRNRFKTKLFSLICAVISFSCLFLFVFDAVNTRSLKPYNQAEMTFNGYVDSVQTNGCVFKVKVDGKVRNVYLLEYDNNFKLGDTLRVKGSVSGVSQYDSSSSRYYKSNNCYLVAEDCTIIPITQTSVDFYPKLKSFLWNLSKTFSQSIDKLFSNNVKGVLKAVLIGDKTQIPTKIKENFKTAGLSHYTAISGLHTGIIASAVFLLLKRLNKRIGAVLTSLFVFFYMALVGFSFSVTRAGIMSIITFVGIAFFLRSDTLTSLGAAVTLILLVNPYSAADIGFQLSVLATFGVVVISPKINRKLEDKFSKLPAKKIKTFVFSAISTTLGANVMLIFHYLFVLNNVSLVSPISNLFASLFMPYPVIFGLITILIYQIPGIRILAFVLKYIAQISMLIIIKIADIMSLIPYAKVTTGQLFLSGWFMLTVLIILYFIITKRKNLLLRTIILSISSLLVLVLCYNVSNNKNISMSLSSSYSGNAVIVTSSNTKFVAATSFDDYTVYGIEKALDLSYNKTIDVLFLDNDNKLNLFEFLDKYNVKNLCINKNNFTDEHIKSIENKVENLHKISQADVSLNNRMSFKTRIDSYNNLAYYISLDNVNVLVTKGRFNLQEFNGVFLDSDIFIINDACPIGIEDYNMSKIFLTNSNTQQVIAKQLEPMGKDIDTLENFVNFKIRDDKYKLTKKR